MWSLFVVREFITDPRQVSERFIFLASSRVSPIFWDNVPSAPVLDIFSDPAKSIKFKTPFFSELSEYL
jgi:hypothetical protein